MLGQRVFYSVDLLIYYMGILLMLMTKRPRLVSNNKSTICKRGIESNYYEAMTTTDGRLPELVQLVGLDARDDTIHMTKTV